MARRKRRKFSDEFKQEAVRLSKQGDRTIGDVARELDLTESALRLWVKQDDADRGKGPPGAVVPQHAVRCRRWLACGASCRRPLC